MLTWADIAAFIKAFPVAVSIGSDLRDWIKKASNGDPVSFLVKIGEGFRQLSQAQTQEDHANAASTIADDIAHLPRS